MTLSKTYINILCVAGISLSWLPGVCSSGETIDWESERLFFTPEERQSHSAVNKQGKETSDYAESSGRSGAIVGTERKGSSRATTLGIPRTDSLIHFSALLSTPGTRTLIVNQIPCVPIRIRSDVSSVLRSVICPGLSGVYPRLEYNIQSEELILTFVDRRQEVMAVGMTR